MKARELREMTDQELAQRLNELRQELFNLRFQMANRQLENTSRIREVRKDIARILTIQRERQLATEVKKDAA